MSAAATGSHEDRVGTQPRRIPARLLRLAPDERLVELLRGGSEAAFEALYARHHRGVLSFCRHMLGSVEEAEDAVQHTFLAAYGDLLRSGREIHLRPWLYAIARNRCLTVLRARRERVEEHAEPATGNLSAEVERRWELRALLGDLAGLPDDQRAALVLAELGDLSHDEIGAALDCPGGKVKALVFQARSSLIASRDAREASCADIREQLANLRGGALRRNLLRRHIRECAGCREFYERVRAQRRELALVLPVTPSLGLKAAVLGSSGAAATGSVVAKTAIVLAVAGGGSAAVETVRESRDRPRAPITTPDGPRAPAAVAGAVEADEVAGEPAVADPAGPAKAWSPRAVTPRPPKARGPKILKAPPPKARVRKPDNAAHGPKPDSPGQANKSREAVPPGQARKSRDGVSPGQANRSRQPDRGKRSDGFAPPGRARQPETAVPPGEARKPAEAVAPSPAQLPDEAAPPAEAQVPDTAAPLDPSVTPGHAKKK